MDDKLLEPLDAYKQFYRAEFEKNASDLFDGLVERSGISLEENRRTVAAYDAKRRRVEELERLLSRNRGLRIFLIFCIVLGLVLLVVGVLLLINAGYLWGSLSLVGGVALAAVGSSVIFARVNPILKRTEEERAKRSEEAEKLLAEARAQMAPLNALFDDNITKTLIERTVPLLKLDDNFNMRRYDYLSTKYGLGEPDDPCRSTIGILTGEILGNPFVVDRELVQTMGMCTYTGSIVISWTTTRTDHEGHTYTEHHTETLVATISRPKPYYSEETRLIYGNEAAPDLNFSRKPAHAERLTEARREKTVRKGAKKIKKLQELAMTDDDPSTNFTEMGNSEFDVLFGALDRDNEVQFRLLFTPLAQKNMLALLTDRAGYGDDFSMKKRGCLNFIRSEHSVSWDLDTDYRRYMSHSADLAKRKLIDFNADYFKHLYFDLAPLLSIPLYQQHKPQEFLYPESYHRNYTPYESEFLANEVGQEAFCHPKTGTQAILKTEFLEKEGGCDRILVTAYSFRTEDRVELVTKLGGDGNLHAVPVHWVEYIPVQHSETAVMKELGLTRREYEGALDTIREATPNADYRGYRHGILCCRTTDEGNSLENLKFKN